MSDVDLRSIRASLQGVIPSPFGTCSADGMPNVTYLSLVAYLDAERVAISRQFLSKSKANLDENPYAQVIVVDPGSGEQHALDLRYLHTETDGEAFESMRANLDAVASQTGMGDVFRLRGADVYHVERVAPPRRRRPPSSRVRSICSSRWSTWCAAWRRVRPTRRSPASRSRRSTTSSGWDTRSCSLTTPRPGGSSRSRAPATTPRLSAPRSRRATG